MKYQLGDTILVLHSNEEGKIVDIINKEMVLVDVDGVRFPVYMDQIDFPYFKRFTEKKKFPAKQEKIYIDNIRKEKIQQSEKIPTGTWLTFIPVYEKDALEDVIEKFKIYLLNHTPDTYQYLYELTFLGHQDFEHQSTILPFMDFYLHDVSFEAMNDSPKFGFDFTLIPANKNKALHTEVSVKIKGKQLFKKIEEMHFKNEPNFSYRLFEKYPPKIEAVVPEYNGGGQKYYDVSRVKQNLEPAKSVIDLHIEKLSDNWRGLSNFEILNIQLNYFEKYYNLAVAHQQPNLIVIHGVGTGKLRTEIHEILKLKREVKSFANQYMANFGFGATEVFFQY